MFLNEEFLRIYEELSIINGNLTEGSFDNEEVYGEAAKTIPGLLRYFVAHIETLAAVVERERIQTSNGESKKPSEGMVNGKKLPFVSFSHQLFSHAYRRGSSWKYGVIVNQDKLEQKVQTLKNVHIEDNYVHENKSSRVFGAAKLSDGTEIIVTSYGHFEMDLNDTKRKALGDISKTGYYEKVKDSFNTRLEAEKEKYADNHAKSVTAESFYCTEVPEVIQRYLKVDTDVLEGFLLVDRRQATGVRFVDICNDVPGLFDYLQDHTTLNEGELRVWLPKDEKYLDISGCIAGIVLPSNYKESNLDNEQNTAPDVVWLRKLIKEKDLTVYVYQSKDESNIPDVDLSRKWTRTLEKPSIMEYFHKITSSKEAIINFINNEMMRYSSYLLSSSSNRFYQMYVYAMAKNTTSDQLDIRISELYNYNAFLKTINEYGFNLKDVAAICRTGQPLLNATEVFEKITSSSEEVQKFLQQISQEFPGQTLWNAYCHWFVANTNAKNANNILEPENIRYNKFIDLCKQKYNYTDRDLTILSKGQPLTIERDSIKNLFKAKTASKKAVLEFVKVLAVEASKRSEPKLSHEYILYMGKNASDIGAPALRKDQQYNYQAWLNKITDPKGPVKLKKEEVLNYFKNFIAEVNNQ